MGHTHTEMNELSRTSSNLASCSRGRIEAENVTRVVYTSLFERGLNITITSGLKMMRIHLFCDKVEKFIPSLKLLQLAPATNDGWKTFPSNSFGDWLLDRNYLIFLTGIVFRHQWSRRPYSYPYLRMGKKCGILRGIVIHGLPTSRGNLFPDFLFLEPVCHCFGERNPAK